MAKQYQEFEVDDYTTILFETDDDDEPLNATDLLCILTSMNSDALKRTGVLSVNAQS